MSFDRKITHGIGFIGTGNMASAMINAIIKHNEIEPEQIFAFDTDESKLQKLRADIGINTLESNRRVVETSSIIFLTVKPKVYTYVLDEIADILSKNHILVSVAAGLTTEFIRERIQNKCKVVRTMPNIACLVEEGITALCTNHELDDEKLEIIRQLLSSFGIVEEFSEDVMDILTAVTGSSPAFLFMFVEAIADAGVMMGIPREQAYRLASQTMLGSAKVLLESQKHPGELKDMVCTPKGTTIQGLYTLEKSGFRGIVIDAIRAATLRSMEIRRENS